ncbi:unnamed protein product [Cylindrotheca closterium]|uniref:Uncharacterized protein n=1 Tax=Cylindrotheca closterium TaxID=2856 RepID=A0AAD2FMQ5_9STRA|nr:unnamed protein product [Cylindrotheca closterium]
MMVLGTVKCILAISLAMMASPCSSFSPQVINTIPPKSATQLQVLEDASSLMVATESWRQYVFPIVTAGVLIDIVLGSPVANNLLSAMRPDAEATSEEGDEQRQHQFGVGSGSGRMDKTKLKERVDSEKFAKDAIARAQNTLELRRYLDDRKTDFDRLEDMKKELDANMQDFDSGAEKMSKTLSRELEKRGKSVD